MKFPKIKYAYIVVGAEGTRDRLVLNGHESRLYDDAVAGSLTFLPPTGVRFVARQERRLLRVTIDVRRATRTSDGGDLQAAITMRRTGSP